MKLGSTFDDFLRSLGALPNLWDKIAFLASLRAEGGGYEHWGMAHVYGQREADAAIAKAHTETFVQLLTTSIQQLGAEAAIAEAEPSANLISQRAGFKTVSNLIPGDLAGGEPRHLQLILRTVSLLARSRTTSTRRVA